MEGLVILWGWRKREDGFWVVWDLPDGPERVMMVTAEMAKGVDYVERTWGELDRRIGAEFGLPDGWLQAHEWRESGGNPKARNPEGTPDPGNDGIGLFQITHPSLKGRHKNADGIWLGGYSDLELQDPERNTRIAARYMRDLIKTYGFDFPRVSAAFNAGSVHPPLHGAENPWNMHQTSGHVTSEVSAYNYWLSMYGPDGLNETSPAPTGTTLTAEAAAAFPVIFELEDVGPHAGPLNEDA
jgi:hypothetical protein